MDAIGQEVILAQCSQGQWVVELHMLKACSRCQQIIVASQRGWDEHDQVDTILVAKLLNRLESLAGGVDHFVVGRKRICGAICQRVHGASVGWIGNVQNEIPYRGAAGVKRTPMSQDQSASPRGIHSGLMGDWQELRGPKKVARAIVSQCPRTHGLPEVEAQYHHGGVNPRCKHVMQAVVPVQVLGILYNKADHPRIGCHLCSNSWIVETPQEK